MAESAPAAVVANATVVRREPLAGCLFRLWVRPDWDLAAAPKQAGQFVRLAVPGPDGAMLKREGRAYSYAGIVDGALEFYVVLVPGGLQTPRLAELAPGARLWCEDRFQGHFTLAGAPALPDLWMIATGAGLAPFVAILRDGVGAYERAVLVHQVRSPEHLAYGAEVAAWARADGRRRYVPVVSQPGARLVARDGHAALFGRVGDAIADGRLEAVAGARFSAERSIAMLCGNPAMIDEVRALLEARGLRRHTKRALGNLLTERYW